MTGYDALKCSKNFPHPDGDQGVELLLIKQPFEEAWTAKPRCAAHPGEHDIPLLQKMSPLLTCIVVPLGGAS